MTLAPSPWRLEEARGLRFIQCAALLSVPGVAHAFSTRQGDAALADAVGLAGQLLPVLRQVHGSRILSAAEAGDGAQGVEADGLVCSREDRRRMVAAVQTADCLPLLLVDSTGSAVAAVHAGWRGTAAGIAGRAVERLAGLGVPPGRLVAALGPTIGSCCYEVGPEVVRAVVLASGADPGEVARPRGDRFMLDLQRANARQLERAGLAPEAIHRAPWCTACAHELFFSYRRSAGAKGRQRALIGWPEAARATRSAAAP